MPPTQSDLDHVAWLNYTGVTSFSGHKILDLGCGSGYLCERAVSQQAVSAVGIDIVSPKMSKGMKEPSSWRFLQLNLDDPTWPTQLSSRDNFSIILAFDIIEHLKSPYSFLTSCRQLIADKGQLIITTPNLMSWERYAKPSCWSGVRDPQHKILFNRYSLKFLLNRTGYLRVHIKAPMRKLSFLGAMQPNLGGQMLCVAEPR